MSWVRIQLSLILFLLGAEYLYGVANDELVPVEVEREYKAVDDKRDSQTRLVFPANAVQVISIVVSLYCGCPVNAEEDDAAKSEREDKHRVVKICDNVRFVSPQRIAQVQEYLAHLAGKRDNTVKREHVSSLKSAVNRQKGN